MEQEECGYAMKKKVKGKRKRNALEAIENSCQNENRKRLRCHSKSSKGAEELFSDRGLDFVSRKLGHEWHSFMINLGMEASSLDQHKINHPQIQQTIFHALKGWAMKVENLPYEQKKTMFFKSLEITGRRNLIDEIAKKFKIEDIMESYSTEDELDETDNLIPKAITVVRDDYRDDNEDNQEKSVLKLPVTWTVVKKSPNIISYENSKGETKSYFNLICHSGNDFHFLRIYCLHEFDDIIVGDTYRFENLVQNKDELWIVKRDCVAVRKPKKYTLSGKIPALPEEDPSDGVQRTLSDAKKTNRLSTVIVKIFKVSEVSYVKNGKLAVRKLAIMDDERNVAKLVLFDENAMATYEINCVVKVTGVYVKSFKGREELRHTRGNSRIKKIKDGYQALREKTIPDEHELLGDQDFYGENLEKYEVDCIYSAHEYACCSYCDKGQIKLEDNECPKCQRPGAGEKGCVVKIGLVSPDGTRDKIVIFKSNTSILFGTTEFVSRNDLKNHLPVTFEGKLSSDKKLSYITNVKRSCPSDSEDD